MGVFVYLKDKKSLVSKLLFAMCLFFTLWVLDIFLLWISAYNDIVMLGWQITPIFEIPIFIFSVYFAFVITDKERKDIHPYLKIFFLLIMGLVFLILPTKLNIPLYNLENCEGVPGLFWGYMYSGEMFAIAWILGLCVQRFKALKKGDTFRSQILYAGAGIVSFLVLFTGSNLLGQITGIQQISFLGSLGMIIFLCFLVYLILRYKVFNIKLFTSQVLTIALWILVGALLFIENIYYIHAVIGVTAIFVFLVGLQLIRSVAREIEQREKIEKLAADLEVANARLKELDQLKSEFLSFASHQIRSPLTAIGGYTSMLLEGDFGEMSAKVKESVQVIDTSSKSLVKIVNEFLDISRIEQGRMKYEFVDFDAKKLAEEVVAELRPNVEKKKLSFEFSADAGEYTTSSDVGKIKQVIGNIIDNSIKYTPEGGIKVHVGRKADKILISVTDTGIGISAEDIPKLFSKFTRAKDANKTNVTGTGLGLYVAKQMLQALNGKIWVESPGKGKGSSFYIELQGKK